MKKIDRSFSVRLGKRPARARIAKYVTRWDALVEKLVARVKATFDGTGYALTSTERDFYYLATDRQQVRLLKLLKKHRVPVVVPS